MYVENKYFPDSKTDTKSTNHWFHDLLGWKISPHQHLFAYWQMHRAALGLAIGLRLSRQTKSNPLPPQVKTKLHRSLLIRLLKTTKSTL